MQKINNLTVNFLQVKYILLQNSGFGKNIPPYGNYGMKMFDLISVADGFVEILEIKRNTTYLL